jgi:small subunit ribosomal protein S6
MRRYELMLLFRPDLEDDKLQSAVEKVTRAIVNAGGALTKVSPWGKRRLAYDIQHFREASYFLLHFDIAPSQIREIERGLLISEEILRHLVTVLEDRGEMSEEDLPAAVPPAARHDDDDDDAAGDDDGEDDGAGSADDDGKDEDEQRAKDQDAAADEDEDAEDDGRDENDHGKDEDEN